MSPESLLGLMWLASPALPVGGFSYSEALEAAIESGHVTDEAAASAWVCDQLELSLARSDLPALHAAWQAWRADDIAAVQQVQDWLLQTRESAEFRLQTLQMGRSLADWLRQQPGDEARAALLAGLTPAPTWPVAFALAGLRTGAGAADVLHAYAFGWAENMVQAAVKAVPLGQSAGQRLLRALVARIPQAVARALVLPDAGRQAFAPMLAILSAQHETQYSRLFRS